MRRLKRKKREKKRREEARRPRDRAAQSRATRRLRLSDWLTDSSGRSAPVSACTVTALASTHVHTMRLASERSPPVPEPGLSFPVPFQSPTQRGPNVPFVASRPLRSAPLHSVRARARPAAALPTGSTRYLSLRRFGPLYIRGGDLPSVISP